MGRRPYGIGYGTEPRATLVGAAIPLAGRENWSRDGGVFAAPAARARVLLKSPTPIGLPYAELTARDGMHNRYNPQFAQFARYFVDERHSFYETLTSLGQTGLLREGMRGHAALALPLFL